MLACITMYRGLSLHLNVCVCVCVCACACVRARTCSKWITQQPDSGFAGQEGWVGEDKALVLQASLCLQGTSVSHPERAWPFTLAHMCVRTCRPQA